MMRIGRSLTQITLHALAAVTLSAGAQDLNSDYQRCLVGGHGSPDARIHACNSALSSGTLDAQNTAVAIAARGAAWKDAKEFERAIVDLTQAIRSGNLGTENLVLAFTIRGDAWRGKKDYDRAIADFNEALRLDPKVAITWANRGYAWQAIEDYDRAIADYNEALRFNPKDVHTWNNRGSAWRAKKDYDRAIADFSEALRLDPKYEYAWSNRGRAHLIAGHADRAAGDLRQAIGLNPTDVYDVIFAYIAASRHQPGAKAGTRAALSKDAAALDAGKWPYAVVEYYLGRIEAAQLLAATDDKNPAVQSDQLCEANFYIAQRFLIDLEPARAIPLLRRAVAECPGSFTEYAMARAELERLGERVNP